MKNGWNTVLGVVVVAFAASTALAQQGQGRGGLGLHTLAANKSVQEELKLSDDQKTKIEEVAKKAQADVQEKAKDLTPEERREKIPGIMKEVNTATEKSLKDVVKEDQLKRLKQIHLQTQGARAFTDEDTTKALKLSDEQAKEITTIATDAQKQIREETKDLTRDDGAKRREISAKINKEALGKIAEKLSADQKKAWKELTGEPFEIKFQQ